MKQFCLAILFCSFGHALAAQDIAIRTGDHPNFTRMVLILPTGTEWELNRIEEGYALRVEEPATLNTDLFFERIKRERISAVRQGGSNSELIVELACDCFAEAFQWRPDQLVIDIKDPGSETTDGALEIRDVHRGAPPISRDLPQPPLPNEVETPRQTLELPILMSDISRSLEKSPTIDPIGQLLKQQSRIGALEAAVANNLDRAVNQGVLQQGQDPYDLDIERPLEEDLAALLDDLEIALTPGLIARTSIDSNMRQSEAQVSNGSGIMCIPNALVDIPSWTNDEPFAARVGALRTQITGEFDRTDPEAIEMLAKTYIAFGFGREAISTMSIDGAKSRARTILQTLAEIIDDDPISVEDFYLQVGCPGHVALWGMLAHKDGPLPAQSDITNIVLSFKLLPKPLREHLAPRLASKLNGMGFHDFADDVLSIGDKNKIDVATAELEIMLDRGATEVAAERLSDLAEDDARITPRALLKLIDINLASETPIKANELTLLRTFQFETQDPDLLQDLYAAEVRVLVEMESYQDAQALIDAKESILTSTIAEEFRNDILGRLAKDSNDAEFLELAFNPNQRVLNPGNQNAFAARLIALGFPQRALDLIDGQATGEDMMERRYLRAEAARMTGEIDAAAAHLAGVTTPRAEQILVGRSDMESEQPTLLPAVNVLTNEEDDPLISDIANRLAEITAFQSDTQTPLTDGRELADEAAILRENMASLLERYEISQ